MIDPREIDFLLDANASKAIQETNDFIAALGRAAQSVESLQNKVNKLYNVQSAPQARQLRSGLSAMSRGDLDTQVKMAAEQSKLSQLRANEASRAIRMEKATTQVMRDQMKVMDGFLQRYDQIIQARNEISRLNKRAQAGDRDALAQQKAELEKARREIDQIVSTLPQARQQAMRNRLERSLTEPGYKGGGRENLAQDYYNARLGAKAKREETNRIVQTIDAEKAAVAAEAAKKQTAATTIALEKDRQARLAEQAQAEKTLYQRMMREYRKVGLPAIMAGTTPADMDRIHRQRVLDMGQRISSTMKGRFGTDTIFDPTSFDEEYALAKEREMQKRAARTAAASVAAADQQQRQFERDQARRERLAVAEQARREKQLRQPQDQALGARRRMDAFGGAGIFSIQGSLMANYATMAAGIGSATYLASYVVELETAMAQLRAISTATKGEMKELESTIISLARNSKFSGKELADAATLMAQAGMSVQQIGATLPAVTNLAVGTDTDLATTVDTITSTMTIFNLQTSEAANVANTLTAAMNMSKLSIDKYALGLQYSGNIADTVGIQYSELAAILGGMADAGVRSGSTLGTGLRQLLLDIQAPTDKAESVFKRLGLSPKDLDVESQGIFRVLRNMKEAGFTTADATQAFEVRAVAAFKAIINKLPDIERLNENILQTSAATEAAAIQMDTLGAKGTQFASAIGAAFYKMSSGIRESLKGVIDLMIMFATLLGNLAPVLNIATTAAVAFFAVWAVSRTATIVKGMFDLSTALNTTTAASRAAAVAQAGHTNALVATNAALMRYSTVLKTVLSPTVLFTAALTAVSFAYGMLQDASQKAQENLDRARQAVNESAAEMGKSKETIEALDDAIGRLSSRYQVLSEKDSPDLRAEITMLQQRFAEYGLTVNQTTDNVDTLLQKMTDLRSEMAQTAMIQARLQMAALDVESEAAAQVVGKELSDKVGPMRFYQSMLGFGRGISNEDVFSALDRRGREKFTRNLEGGTDTFNLMGQYYNRFSGKDLSPTDIQNLDLEQIRNDIAQMAQFRDQVVRMRAEWPRATKKDREGLERFDEYLRDFDLAFEFVRKVEAAAAEQRNISLKRQQAETDLKSYGAVALANSMGIDTAVGGVKRDFNQRVLDVKELESQGYGPDFVFEEMDKFRGEVKGTVEKLKTLKNDFIMRAIQEGLAKDEAEADELFKRLPVYEDYQFATSIADRSTMLLQEEANKVYQSLGGRLRQGAAANANSALERGKLGARLGQQLGTNFDPANIPPATLEQLKKDNPEFFDTLGNLINLPMTMNQAAAEILAQGTAEQEAARRELEAKYPGLFDVDDKGRMKNPGFYQEYLSSVEQIKAGTEGRLAKLYRAYGLDYDDGASGRREANPELEYLRMKEGALRSRLEKIKSSVDSQSSVEAIESAIGQYEAVYSELEIVAKQVKDIEWSEKKFKDPALAAKFKDLFDQEFMDKLAEVGVKSMADLQNLLGDVMGKQTAQLAKARFKSLEQRLASNEGGMIDSKTLLDARLQVGQALMNGMVEAYIEEFNNTPGNREKLDDPEVKARLAEGVSQFVMRQAEYVMAISERYLQTRLAEAQSLVNARQYDLSQLDNRLNAPAVSNTERGMRSQAVAKAQEEAAKTRVSALQDKIAAQQVELDRLNGVLAATDESSPEHLAALNARLALTDALAESQRDLVDATNAYAAATDQAIQPSQWEMYRFSLEKFIEQEGVLMNASRTIADNLGNVFRAMKDGFAEAVTSVVTGAASIGDAFRQMTTSILKAMLDMAVKILTNYLIIQAIKLVARFLPGGGFSQDFVDVFEGAGFKGIPVASGKALGGKVTGGVPGRDSVLTPLMPGEIVMRKSAVDMIGEDTLLRANATGRLAQNTAIAIQQQKREPDMVNVYVVAPENKPSMGPKDVVVTIMDDVRQGGALKKMIKQVAVGGA